MTQPLMDRQQYITANTKVISDTYQELQDTVARAAEIGEQLTVLEKANTHGRLDEAVAAAQRLAEDINAECARLHAAYLDLITY